MLVHAKVGLGFALINSAPAILKSSIQQINRKFSAFRSLGLEGKLVVATAAVLQLVFSISAQLSVPSVFLCGLRGNPFSFFPLHFYFRDAPNFPPPPPSRYNTHVTCDSARRT